MVQEPVRRRGDRRAVVSASCRQHGRQSLRRPTLGSDRPATSGSHGLAGVCSGLRRVRPATDTGVLVALFLGYGLYFGLTEPVERAWVASLAPNHARGGAFGLYHGAIGLTALPASLLFGVIYAVAGPGAAFGTGAALTLAAAAILVGVPGEKPPAPLRGAALPSQ